MRYFATVLTVSVLFLWTLIVTWIIRGLAYVFGLNQNAQNTLFYIALGMTLLGIVAYFRRVHLREKAQIAALQTASSDELDAIMKSRPDFRYAIAREVARRMVLERLRGMSNEGLDEFAESDSRALALLNAERLRRTAN